MTYQTFQVGGGSNPRNPFSSLISLVIFIAVLVGLFFLVGGFIKLLYWVAPVLLIITLLINYRVVADYALDIYNTFQNDILMGMVKVGFAILAYPLVIGWLFAKALVFKKVESVKKNFEQQINQMNQQMGSGNFQNPTQEEYADFEELSSEPAVKKEESEPIEFIEMPKPKDKQAGDYDEFFK